MGVSDLDELDKRWKRLKNTTHVNVAFGTSRCDENLLRELLRWLNGLSVSPASDEQLQAHLDQLERRRRGLDGLIEMAQEAGEKYLSAFQVPRRFMPSYGFAEFDLGTGRLVVSLDLLNAGGELGFPEDAGEIVEIFWVGVKEEAQETPEERQRRWQLERERLRQLVKDIVRVFDARFIFGGYVSYVSRYVAWLQKSRSKTKPRRALPWEFLWPLTYLPRCDLDEAPLKALPVHHAERMGAGALVQVFEDLHMGYQDKYEQAAHALGLRAVWELNP